ncbi:unnamed protein product [Paramecium sonneborni]|uniref:Uncharacterized protein n=1 Tax=Paramecium sonneborni TaxID=65129 RepID=A0A8S1RG89_9CILI|nr:unnamed protein product [Paramecium sonneborni]
MKNGNGLIYQEMRVTIKVILRILSIQYILYQMGCKENI